jgi:DNA mismatch endonuclease, patch repair protein
MDKLSKEKRSWNMSRIRSKDTRPEFIVRSMLHRMGYRFRIHVKGLPGCPDIVLPKYRAVIFVHGCFWHRHPGCKYAYTPKSRQAFWTKKFQKTVERHEIVTRELERQGWKTMVVWECETANTQKIYIKLIDFIE